MNRIEKMARAGAILFAMASVTWAALPMARHAAGVVVLDAPTPVDIPARQTDTRPDLAELLALAPFGRTPVQDRGDEPVPETPPDIFLRGIFATNDTASTALLDVAGEPGLYRTAMPVTNRLTVSQIAPAFVELTDGQSIITLRFDADAELVNPTQVAQSDPAVSLMDRLQGGFVVAARYEKPGKPETTADYIDYWRHRIRKNPQAVLDEIGLKPTKQGYVIAENHDTGVRLAGLRAGDLVRTVNGQPVGDPDADTQFYDQIATSGHARIEVERGSRILSFSFPLR